MIGTSLIVTALSLVGSFMGFLVQMLMASHYGTGVNVDAYLYSISLPIFLSGMISALFSYTIIPNLAKKYSQLNLQNQFIVSVLSLSLLLAILLISMSPILISVQGAALPLNSEILKQKYIERLFFLGWCIAGMQIIVSACCSILTGLKKPIFSTFLILGPYSGMLGFMLNDADKGIEHLAWGFLIGTTVSATLAFYTLRMRVLSHWRNVSWLEIRSIVLYAPYTLIAMSCFSAYAVIDSYWAPRGGQGVLASLGYSQRLMIALGNLAVAGPSAVFAPMFSELIVQGNRREFEKLFNKIIAGTFLISFSLAILLFNYGELLVQLLFVRGEFNQDDASRVAIVLKYCLPGMVCMLLSVICFRILFCFRNVEKKAAIIGVLWILSYFLLSGLFINHSEIGIAIAYSFTWVLCFMFIIIIINLCKKEQLIALK